MKLGLRQFLCNEVQIQSMAARARKIYWRCGYAVLIASMTVGIGGCSQILHVVLINGTSRNLLIGEIASTEKFECPRGSFGVCRASEMGGMLFDLTDEVNGERETIYFAEPVVDRGHISGEVVVLELAKGVRASGPDLCASADGGKMRSK